MHQQLQGSVFYVLNTEGRPLLLCDLAYDLSELVLVDLIPFSRLGLFEDLPESLACGINVCLDDFQDGHETSGPRESAHLGFSRNMLPILGV
mgnify:CR=1 FL=1